MASETSRPGASADSYIGSLISLTSKFEIRYEGVLYNINTEESSIGLVNVRSFGTEGRKKEGPQIPASDKIYEYILFRGSDIKDLQVKSSPPVQSAPIHNDPAIIQSHYSRPPPSSTSFPPVGSGTVAELSSNPAQGGLPKPPFQGNLPLYQPGGSLGSWASSPAPPTASGSGLAMPGQMPMYWQGYYAPAGTLPHMQQPPFVRLPPGLSIPQSLQQPLQYPAVTGSLTSGSQNMQEVPSSLMPTFSSTSSSTSATNPSTLAPFQVNSLPPESSSSQMQSKATLTSYPTSVPALNLSFMPQFASSLESVNSFSQNVPASISSNPRLANHQAGPQSVAPSSSNQLETSSTNLSFAPQLTSNSVSVSLPHNMPASVGSNPRALPVPSDQTMPQSVSSVVDLTRTNQVETAASLVTPNQLLQPSLPVVFSSQPLQTSTKDVEVKPEEDKSKPLLPEPPMLAPADTKEPILPLPTPTHQQSNGAVLHTHQFARGRGRGPRGRGNGYPRPVARFTQDFDFDAMNEKFNKDEVWGHLGKNKSQSRDADEDDEEYYEDDEDGSEPTKSDKKPVYVKDDFFDTLSCNSLDRESRNGRTRFSEQLKIDTETFGEFSRHHPNRGGGRGYRGGGRARGSYYGRGFGGYGGRGGGRGGPYRPF